MTSLKKRLKEQRETARRQKPGVLPLAAYYGREATAEIRRDAFYNDMAAIYGWPIRFLVPMPDDRPEDRLEHPGRGGRPLEVAQIDRTRGINLILNAAPWEWLIAHGHLETKDDPPRIASVRYSAGHRLRDLMIGAERSGLRSANLEGASGGGGAPVIVTDYMLDCSAAVERVRSSMPRSSFALLESVVYLDQWAWENKTAARAAAILERLRKGLDLAAVTFGMLSQKEMETRWAREPQN